jgi:hypothetical protein
MCSPFDAVVKSAVQAAYRARRVRIGRHNVQGRLSMSFSTLLLIALLLVIGTLPAWPYSSHWGYAPSGILGAALLIVLVLFLMGRL